MILRVHHVQITIPPDAESMARRFYCGVLGLPEISKPSSLQGRGGLWVRCGDRQIHIGTEGNVDRLATKAHLAYEVADLAHWRRLIAEEKLPILESVPIAGFERFECRDPFGNRLEFIQPLG